MLLFLAHQVLSLLLSMLLFLVHHIFVTGLVNVTIFSTSESCSRDMTVCNLKFTLSVEEVRGVCMCMLNIPQLVKQPPTKLIYLVTKEAPLYEREI